MTEQDYELLSQYLDGELSVLAAQVLEQRLATEPKLQANLQRLKEIDDSLKSAFNSAGLDRVPANVIDLLERPAARVVPLRPRRAASWGFALAASLAVAVSAVLVPRWLPDSTPSGKPVADAMLAIALDQSASRGEGWDVLPDGRKLRPVLSFQSNTGQWCREFLLSAGEPAAGGNWRGVACRDNRGWVNEILVGEELAGSANEYRPAGAAVSDQVAAFIDKNATDIALSAEQEAALIARRWQ